MREVSLDTETTGLDPLSGDRIVEIGCVELFNHAPTGRSFQVYISPGRQRMSPEAVDITGLTDEFLADKPRFEDVADAFKDFIGADPLVIHNAAFDVKFINAEFNRLGWSPLDPLRVIDSLALARRRFPGGQASLDALCRRFSIDNSTREKHGALLDAELLGEVYLELRGGRQPTLALASEGADAGAASEAADGFRHQARPPRRPRATSEELAAHAAFVDDLPEALWREAAAYRERG
ncbi:MAG: DNA polymerase III subunit epsilon [Pseudomonadota bacterium]